MITRPATPDAAGLAEVARLAEFAIRWTEGLHGAACLRDTLARLAQATGARTALVHRDCLATGRQRTLASVDADAATGARPLVRAFGAGLIDADPAAVVPGTLWTLGELDARKQDDLDPRILRWMDDRGLRDAAVVPLALQDGGLDILEFHTAAPLAARAPGLALLARLTAVSWAGRNEDRIGQMLQATPGLSPPAAPRSPDANPLSPDNPWGLTAAEMRICALIRAGIDPADIARQTRIASSTLRSHLRSIYAKGQIPGQIALVRHLLDNNTREDAIDGIARPIPKTGHRMPRYTPQPTPIRKPNLKSSNA